MTALSQVDIRAIKEQHLHGEKIERLLQQPERLIASLLIGNNVANISLSAIVAYMTSLYLGGFFIALSTFFLTLFIIIFCEIAPKQIALIFKRQIAIAVVWAGEFFLYHVYAITESDTAAHPAILPYTQARPKRREP